MIPLKAKGKGFSSRGDAILPLAPTPSAANKGENAPAMSNPDEEDR